MKLRSTTRRLWRGTGHDAEYLCVAHERGLFRPRAILSPCGSQQAVDVTDVWLLVGIRPVLVAVPAPLDSEVSAVLRKADEAVITLTEGAFFGDSRWRNARSDRKWMARLRLQRAATATIGGQEVHLLQAVEGRHKLLTPRQRAGLASFDALQRLRKSIRDGGRGQGRAGGPGDPLLPEGNRYEQLRIGYSTARPVRAATVEVGELGNIFPIDIQGPLGDQAHIVSLRAGAKVGEQLAEVGRFAVGRVHAQASAEVYGLGRQHMQPPTAEILRKGRENGLSARWAGSGPFLHEATTDARLLAIEDVLSIGKHRVHLCRVEDTAAIEPEAPTLAHLHLWFAMWLDRTGRSPRYLPR